MNWKNSKMKTKMKKLLPNDRIKERVKEAIAIVELLEPTVCPNDLNLETYGKLLSIMNFFHDFLIDKKFCFECKGYYYSPTACYKCKWGVDGYFSKLTPSLVKQLKDRYRGTYFKQPMEESTEETAIEVSLSPIEKLRKTLTDKYLKTSG